MDTSSSRLDRHGRKVEYDVKLSLTVNSPFGCMYSPHLSEEMSYYAIRRIITNFEALYGKGFNSCFTGKDGEAEYKWAISYIGSNEARLTWVMRMKRIA